MQNILARWQSLPREDLFAFWQDELSLKKELRSQGDAYGEVKLDSEADYQFARLSLAYGEGRQHFFAMLFFNMNHQPVQSALIDGPEYLYEGFLQAVPEIICQEHPSPRALQFLISIYREDFLSYFTEIVKALDKPACDYLLERTASKSLRQLLSRRQQEFDQSGDENGNGSLNSLSGFQGIFADKIQNMHQTAKSSLNQTNRENTAHSVDSLQTAELLFMTGQLKACLSILTGVHKHLNGEDLQPAVNEPQVFKNLQRVTNKVLPIYFLLRHPLHCSQYCLQCFQQDFQGLSADESAIFCLELYTRLLANYQGNPTYTLLEIASNNRKREEGACYRLPVWLRSLHQGDDEANALVEISRYAHENITALPHESFVIMEFIRWLTNVKRIMPDREINAKLLSDYIRLYQWIPSPLFMNREILSQLANPADREMKLEADHILEQQTQYSLAELNHMYKDKLDELLKDPVFKPLLAGLNLGV